MVLKRVGVLSCGKIMGLLYVGIGLIAGVIFALASMVGEVAGLAADEGGGAILALFFGVGAVIFLPVFYGVMGFISGVVSAFLYNLLAGWIGGIELEFEGPSVGASS